MRSRKLTRPGARVAVAGLAVAAAVSFGSVPAASAAQGQGAPGKLPGRQAGNGQQGRPGNLPGRQGQAARQGQSGRPGNLPGDKGGGHHQGRPGHGGHPGAPGN
jgi:hypothetical protein